MQNGMKGKKWLPQTPQHTHLVCQKANYLCPSIASLIQLFTSSIINNVFRPLTIPLCNTLKLKGIANLWPSNKLGCLMNFLFPKLVASKWFCFENPYASCFESLKMVAMNGCCTLNISRSLSLEHLWFCDGEFSNHCKFSGEILSL